MPASYTRIAPKRLARPALKLECVTGDIAFGTLDKAGLEQDLSTSPATAASLPPVSLHVHEHVATASASDTGRIVCLLGASRVLTSREPILLVEQVRVHDTYQRSNVSRRLLAMVMLRMAGIDGMPAALAIRAPDGWTTDAFLSLTRHFSGAVCYPAPADKPVALASALLAKRIASAVAPSIRYEVATSTLRGARIARVARDDQRGTYGTSTAINWAATHPVTTHDDQLLILDLRSEDETTLIDDARRIYRGRGI